MKDIYNREEVIELIRKAAAEVNYPENYYEPINSDEDNDKEFEEYITDFIKENLK